MTPPTPVSIENWLEPAHLSWSFTHMEELFPTHCLDRGEGPVAGFDREGLDLGSLPVETPEGPATVGEILAAANTDAWAVVHGETIVAEHYGPHLTADTPHLLMSVSKSVLSIVLATLVEDGTIDLAATIGELIPAMRTGGYADARVTDVLDMRTGIRFSEEYLDPRSEVRLLDEAVGWAPLRAGNPATLAEFLPTLVKETDHGGPFAYRSADTDVLGWLIETVTGRPYTEVASERLWSRIGAQHDASITVDPAGLGMFDGGTSATLLDLARFGHLLLRGGRSLTGERIVSADWVEDLFSGGPDSEAAFAQGPYGAEFPGGKYRRQFWSTDGNRDLICGVGINGQLLYLDRAHDVLAVKFASQALPVDHDCDVRVHRAFAAIAEHVARVRSGS